MNLKIIFLKQSMLGCFMIKKIEECMVDIHKNQKKIMKMLPEYNQFNHA